MKKNKIVNIAYLGGSHGSFMLFFIDKFSKLTPDISGTPFSATGTSHSQSIKFSGKVDRETFEDLHGRPRNDYKPDPTVPNIVIEVDEKSLMNFTRLFFTRKGDQEHTATFLSVSEDKTSVHIDEHFVNRYKDSFKLLYDFDVTKTLVIPISLMRDFLKITFLRMQNDRTLQSMEKIKANVTEKDELLKLSDIWNTDAFIDRMQQISDSLNLDLVLGKDAISLHKQFLSKRVNHETWNRVYDVIDAIKNKQNMDCSKLDIVEQGYVYAWIEKNNDYIQTPLTRNFFVDTNEILEYIKVYPNHYKAMNPNLAKFNNIDNPFYLWAKGKKL